MEKGYIVSPVNGMLICKYDKTFFIEYLPGDHVFVKNKFGAVRFSGFARQIWLNRDLLIKFGSWLEPYIVGHERAHVYFYDWYHQKVQAERNSEYWDHEIFMEKEAIKYVGNYYEDDIYNKCLKFHNDRVDELNQKREEYADRN
jgi:hypothetical protein